MQLEETIRLLRVELDKERDEKEKMKYERDVIKTQSKEVSRIPFDSNFLQYMILLSQFEDY